MKSMIYVCTDIRTGEVRVFLTLAEAAEAFGGSHQGVQQAVAYGRQTYGCTWKKSPRIFAVRTAGKEYYLCTLKEGKYVPMCRHEPLKSGDVVAAKDVSLSMYK